jgi:hypothetical protein
MHVRQPRSKFDAYICATTEHFVVYDYNKLTGDLARDLRADMDEECAEEMATWLIEDEHIEPNPEGGESARYLVGATVFWWSAGGSLESTPLESVSR